MTPNLDSKSMLKGLEFMADVGLPEYDELRQAIGSVIVATANLDFQQGLMSQSEHAAMLARVQELSPVPTQKH